MRLRRPGRLVAALPLLLCLTACDQVAETVSGPDPADAARALAAGLVAGDLTGSEDVAVDDAEASTSYAAVVGDLLEDTGVTPSVEVLAVDEGVPTADGAETATAELVWTWPLGEEWTYETQAPMTLVDDTWTLTWSPSVVEPSLVAGEALVASALAPQRGDVKGAGSTLVTERPVVRFGIDKSRLSKKKAVRSARALARLVDVGERDVVARVKSAGERAFVEAITFRRGDVPARVTDGFDGIDGALALDDDLALAPTRDFAAPILGRVGPVTAEMVEEQPEVYSSGDVAGLSGLQARYDEQLRGTPGLLVTAVPGKDAASESLGERELFRVDATRGEALRLTLDRDLQTLAERLLADQPSASALVALRPGSGEILAAANGPGTGGVNVATFGQAAPGSTFKTVTSLALLRAGLDASSQVSCTDEVVVDGKRFGNYSDYPAGGLGRIPLRSAVANSCNTAFINARDRLDDGDLAAAAASLGLGVDHEVGFPAYFGQVPAPESQTEAAADLIGQGRVLASPMAMAAVVGSVQSGRTTVPPADAEPLTGQEARALRSLLRAVVTDGSGRALAGVPGQPVIAKTGTAEFSKDGEVLTHAWMVAARSGLAVAVYVDEGVSGSRTAGPIMEAFLRGAPTG